MTKIISIAGKGGTGKTTLAALIIRNLLEISRPVLAIDADPNTNLHEKLGARIEKTIGNLREEMLRNTATGGLSKTEFIEYQIRTLITEANGFDLLAMGRPEGPGCYCYVNNLLRTFLAGLSQKYSFVVIDNEAGMEHLSRRTTGASDLMLLVSDATPTGVATAIRLKKLSLEMMLQVRKYGLIINRVRGRIAELTALARSEFNEIFVVPYDAQVERFETEMRPLLSLPANSPAVEHVDMILRRTLNSR